MSETVSLAQTEQEGIEHLTNYFTSRMTEEVDLTAAAGTDLKSASVSFNATEENYWLLQTAMSNCHAQFEDLGFQAETRVASIEADPVNTSSAAAYALELTVNW